MLPKINNDNSVILSAVDDFFKKGFSDGDVLSMHWVKESLDIKEPKKLSEVNRIQFETLQKINMFKTELLTKHNIALRNVRGSGYMVVPPKEQTYYAIEEGVKHFNKGIKKAENLLDNMRISKLNSEDKKRHTDTQVKFSAIKGIMSRQKKDMFLAFR